MVVPVDPPGIHRYIQFTYMLIKMIEIFLFQKNAKNFDRLTTKKILTEVTHIPHIFDASINVIKLFLKTKLFTRI